MEGKGVSTRHIGQHRPGKHTAAGQRRAAENPRADFGRPGLASQTHTAATAAATGSLYESENARDGHRGRHRDNKS